MHRSYTKLAPTFYKHHLCLFVIVRISLCASRTCTLRCGRPSSSLSLKTLQDYLKDTKACLTNDFSRYKRALTSVRQELPDADSLAQVGK